MPALLDTCDAWVFDCDGTLYVGHELVPGAAEVVAAARARRERVLFVTNDPTRSSETLAAKLADLGIEARPSEILHAGRAAAIHLARVGAHSALVLGTAAFADEITGAGVRAVASTAHLAAPRVDVDAVAVGLDEDLGVADLDLAVRSWRPGMHLVAANADRTYPGANGLRMGSGALARSLAFALDVDPAYCGKPSPILFSEAESLLGTGRIGLVGDNLEADVAGAVAAGWTAVWFDRTGAGDVDRLRPSHAVRDLRELL